jgi:thiamine monophosphate synthase
MVLLRHVSGDAHDNEGLLRACLSIARRYHTLCFLHGDAAKAHALGFDGVHWRAAQLDGQVRARGLLQAASCHSPRELQLAASQGVDLAVLSPVRSTPSHPERRALGWGGFAGQVIQVDIPVYALGGMTPGDLGQARQYGAHGVAGIRAFWPER